MRSRRSPTLPLRPSSAMVVVMTSPREEGPAIGSRSDQIHPDQGGVAIVSECPPTKKTFMTEVENQDTNHEGRHSRVKAQMPIVRIPQTGNSRESKECGSRRRKVEVDIIANRGMEVEPRPPTTIGTSPEVGSRKSPMSR